eukprot:7855154-Pyramimonas_sp.AAC.1
MQDGVEKAVAGDPECVHVHVRRVDREVLGRNEGAEAASADLRRDHSGGFARVVSHHPVRVAGRPLGGRREVILDIRH